MGLVFDMPFHEGLQKEIKNLEGYQWNPDTKVWSASPTARNFFSLDCLTQEKKLLRRWFKPLRKDINPKRNLWHHQDEMFRRIITYSYVVQAAEMRTGKTLPTIEAIEAVSPELIWWVAPKSALKGLEIELNKWNLQDKFSKKLKLLTYDKFRTIINGDIYDEIPDFIVFDEAQKLKSPTTAQTQAAFKLTQLQETRYRDKPHYRVALSGTPSPKDPSDWWALCEAIQPGFIKEPNKDKLKNRLSFTELDTSTAGHGFYKFLGWNEEEVANLKKRLSGLVAVYLKKDCLDLPPIRYEEVTLKPSKQILLAVKGILSKSSNSLDSMNKIRQLSDGFLYQKEYNEDLNRMEAADTEFYDCPKDQQFKEDLEEFSDTGRLVVYAGFKASVDKLVEIAIKEDWTVLRIDARGYHVFGSSVELPSSDLCLSEMDRSSDSGSVSKLVVIAQADSASTGLEFSASPVIIYYSNTNNGASRMQSEARAHSNNMDKEKGLVIRDYIHLPVDKKILDSLKLKKDLQAISMGELKTLMSELEDWKDVWGS